MQQLTYSKSTLQELLNNITQRDSTRMNKNEDEDSENSQCKYRVKEPHYATPANLVNSSTIDKHLQTIALCQRQRHNIGFSKLLPAIHKKIKKRPKDVPNISNRSTDTVTGHIEGLIRKHIHNKEKLKGNKIYNYNERLKIIQLHSQMRDQRIKTVLERKEDILLRETTSKTINMLIRSSQYKLAKKNTQYFQRKWKTMIYLKKLVHILFRKFSLRKEKILISRVDNKAARIIQKYCLGHMVYIYIYIFISM